MRLRLKLAIICSVAAIIPLVVASIFIDKLVDPRLERKITWKSKKLQYIARSLLSFALIFSWFVIIILLLCAAMGSMFVGMILLLMAPIYLFGSFAGAYFQQLTRSSLPNVLLQTVYLMLLIVTLSPVGSLLSMLLH